MNKKLLAITLSLTLLVGCRSRDDKTIISSIQLIGRNGFSETISNTDRLKRYEEVDFLTSQPFEKVLRVYKKDPEGKSHSKLTSYHPNGGIWQYLEALDGRAHGRFLEWYENGKVRIEANVIEGIAELSENAQQSWLFDKDCSVWDEEGNLRASFQYSKGYLTGEAKYFHPNGAIEQLIPYTGGVANGSLKRFDIEGILIEEIPYVKGKKEGIATASWKENHPKYREEYQNGFLLSGTYFDSKGNNVGEIKEGFGNKVTFDGEAIFSSVEYRNGTPEGLVKLFASNGTLQSSYHILDGKKHGEEWEYYPSKGGKPKPKISIQWFEDQIQGMVKTWYPNGVLESQREITGNKKQGLSFAYYRSGELMLMEEYENDRLLKGEYYKKGEKSPISTIQNGEGMATLFNPEGEFLKKIPYERSKPQLD